MGTPNRSSNAMLAEIADLEDDEPVPDWMAVPGLTAGYARDRLRLTLAELAEAETGGGFRHGR